MANKMHINISDLRLLSEQLLSHLEGKGRSSVEISNDYYWSIPKERRYDPSLDPGDFTLGQLTDDWNELQRILEGKSEPFSYALVWLSSIFQAIGEEFID